MAGTLQDFVEDEYGVVISERAQPEGVRTRDIIRWANQCIVSKNNEIAALKRQVEETTKLLTK